MPEPVGQFSPEKIDQNVGRIFRCAVAQNYSINRWTLAPEKDRYSFNGQFASTLEQAHEKGCHQCQVRRDFEGMIEDIKSHGKTAS